MLYSFEWVFTKQHQAIEINPHQWKANKPKKYKKEPEEKLQDIKLEPNVTTKSSEPEGEKVFYSTTMVDEDEKPKRPNDVTFVN